MRYFSFIFILLMFLNNCFSQNNFINLRGDTVAINDNECYFITLSSVSCHQCYEEIEQFLTYYNYYDNNTIYILCIDNKTNISTVVIRKYLQSFAKQYFPQIDKSRVLFKAIDDTDDTIFDYQINVKGIPVVFHKTDNKIQHYSYEEFISD